MYLISFQGGTLDGKEHMVEKLIYDYRNPIPLILNLDREQNLESFEVKWEQYVFRDKTCFEDEFLGVRLWLDDPEWQSELLEFEAIPEYPYCPSKSGASLSAINKLLEDMYQEQLIEMHSKLALELWGQTFEIQKEQTYKEKIEAILLDCMEYKITLKQATAKLTNLKES
jgi:hypothetical protein